jgi:hypothetical protein
MIHLRYSFGTHVQLDITVTVYLQGTNPTDYNYSVKETAVSCDMRTDKNTACSIAFFWSLIFIRPSSPGS